MDYKGLRVDRRRKREKLEPEVVGNIGNRMVYVREVGAGPNNPWQRRLKVGAMGTCTGQGCVRKDGRRVGRGKAWRERVARETPG